MLKAAIQYSRDEILPRAGSIIFATEMFFAVLVAISVAMWGTGLIGEGPRISDLTSGIAAYAAIALGFCVAGMTIALTLPDKDFAQRMASFSGDGKRTSSFSDLLFVFSWTAIVHWVELVGVFSVMVLADSSKNALGPSPTHLRLTIVGSLFGLGVYCLCQFFVTFVTISQVGNVYINWLKKNNRNSGL